MHSRNNSIENSSKSKGCQQISDTHIEDISCPRRVEMKRQATEKSNAAEADTIVRSPSLDTKQRNNTQKREDLSRDDLLFLLSVLEGELQASIICCLIAITMDARVHQ